MAIRLQKHGGADRLTYNGETLVFDAYERTCLVEDEELAEQVAEAHRTVTVKTRNPTMSTETTDTETPEESEDE